MSLDNTQFNWAIENVKDFNRRLDRLAEVSNDFRIPFRLISSDFYRSQKQLFSLKGAGMFTDLSEKPFYATWENALGFGAYYGGGYKEYKSVNLGFVYPILVGRTKDLSQSTLTKTHPYSIFYLDRQQLQIGSSVPYGKYHQSDKERKKIPQRKFVFIDGGKGDKSRGSGINGRRDRWTNIIDDHFLQLLTGEI